MEPAFGEKFFKWEVPARQVAWGDFASMEQTSQSRASQPVPGCSATNSPRRMCSWARTCISDALSKLFPNAGPIADYVARCAARPALKRALAMEERFIAEADGKAKA